MSKKIRPKDDVAREMVKQFCQYVVYIKAIHRTVKELFENEEGIKLMKLTAESFFKDLNEILIDYFLLEAAKITDPTRTHNKYENFTIANLRETIDWPEDVAINFDQLIHIVKDFRKNIIDARNKLLAHYDKKTFISNEVLGTFPEGEDEKFIIALEKICDVLHQASFDYKFGDIVVAMPGDVHDLKETLKRAVAFEKLFKESKGEEKMRLFKMLE